MYQMNMERSEVNMLRIAEEEHIPPSLENRAIDSSILTAVSKKSSGR